jgi:hypothetical protein
LIDELAASLSPTASSPVLVRLTLGAGLGAVVSTVLVGLVLGYRPDLRPASATATFWVKLAYPSLLCALALWSVERLSRPGGAGRRRRRWLMAPILSLGAAALLRLSQTPAHLIVASVMGASAAVCPWLVAIASLPPLAGLVWAMRAQAPTRLTATGAMLGVAAGGAGAAAYALHCTETSLSFLAIWYTLGIAAAGLIGSLLGRPLLRW